MLERLSLSTHSRTELIDITTQVEDIVKQSKVVKFAISIPEEDFKKLEALRQQERLTRSKAVLQAVKLWEESKSMRKLIRKYEEGYKKIPETIGESIAWEKASLTALTKEEW